MKLKLVEEIIWNKENRIRWNWNYLKLIWYKFLAVNNWKYQYYCYLSLLSFSDSYSWHAFFYLFFLFVVLFFVFVCISSIWVIAGLIYLANFTYFLRDKVIYVWIEIQNNRKRNGVISLIRGRKQSKNVKQKHVLA